MKILLATVTCAKLFEAQIRRHRPAAVVVICTRESATGAEQVLRSIRGPCPSIDDRDPCVGLAYRSVLIEGRHRLERPQEAIEACERAARKGLEAAKSLLGETEGEIVIDLTGGTKPMTLGLWMVCPPHHPPYYLAGQRASEDASSREVTLQRLPDPRLPRLALEQVDHLIRSGYFKGAARLAEEAHERFHDLESLDPHLSRRLASTRRIASALGLWELCDYSGAAHALKFDPRRVLPPDADPDLEPSIAALRRWLDFLGSPRIPYLDPDGKPLALDVAAFAHDCLLSARRLAGRMEFDFAVLKLYRAIEAALQAEFARIFEGRSNSKFPVRLLPPPCRAAWEAEHQTANLGLERTLRVLEHRRSPLATRFGSLRADLPAWERAPISFVTQFIRNHGPMTHGFVPITAEKYRLCLDETEQLLGPPEIPPPSWEEWGRTRT